ncbi:hypothetical protein T484DRAFT_1952800, partial [Baffinella frigidus]
VQACEEQARGVWGYEEIFLHVKVSNRRAQRLYTRQGYLCELREPNLYQLKSGESRVRVNPRLFFRKEISPPSSLGEADARALPLTVSLPGTPAEP